jgi:hypothetical protein
LLPFAGSTSPFIQMMSASLIADFQSSLPLTYTCIG